MATSSIVSVMSQILRSILTEPWAMQEEVVYSYLPGVWNILNGKPFGHDFGNNAVLNAGAYKDDGHGEKPERAAENPYLLPSAKGKLVDNFDLKMEQWGYSEIPEGSVFVLQVRGEILKYSQACGPMGTTAFHGILNKANEHKNIEKIILVVDSPGGQVGYTGILANAIYNCETPVYTFVEGLAASAGYWIGAAGKEVYVSTQTDTVGSIGTMVFFADFIPWYEKEGVNIHKFYATLSTEKNALFDKVLKGDYKDYIKQKLDPLNESFHADIRKFRPGVKDDVFAGATYYAEDAKAMGLIDGVLSYADFVGMVVDANPADASATPETPNSNSNMGLLNNKSKVPAAVESAYKTSLEEDPSAEILQAANDELEAKNSHLRVVSSGDLETMTSQAGDLETANTQVAELTTKLAAANKAKTTAEQAAEEAKAAQTKAEGERDTAQADQKAAEDALEEYKEKTPGAQHTAVVPDPEKKAADSDAVDYSQPEFASDANQKANEILSHLNIENNG